MPDLVQTGVGLSRVRDSIATRETRARALVVAAQVALECGLSFTCLAERAGEPVLASAWAALEAVWG